MRALGSSGRAGQAAGARQGSAGARQGAAGALQGAGHATGEAQARGARQAGAGHAGRARPGQGCALGALRLVFNPVFRLGIFPESLNEHCSL